MAALTVDEIEYIRSMSGDTCEDYDVSPTFLQKLYDRALTTTCGCSDSLDIAVVLVLRVRLAKAQRLFNEDGEGGARSLKQKRDHIKEDLERWESRCGMSGGGVTIGTLDLGIDSDCTDEYTSRLSAYSIWGGWL